MTTAGDQVDQLVAWIRQAVADTLEIEASAVDPDRPLTELGLASRDAVGLVGDLEDRLDRSIDATIVFETPTISLLARRLLGVEETTDAAYEAGAGPDASETPATEELVAVVGVGCRLPGGIEGPDAFWDLLLKGGNAVGQVPDDRWSGLVPPGAGSAGVLAATSRHGGYLPDIATFDAEHFGVSPREAELMDPQQRMLLEVTWEALEHAGIDPDRLRGTNTGVYVGMCSNEYAYLTTADLTTIEPYTATGAALSIASNRISYLLDLHGPSLTVDTACSSSLVALHQAVTAIRAGEATTAIVGGANLLLAPAVTVNFDRAGALAPDGRCKPFSDDADGIVRAEGCGVVILKRLTDAARDGDRVLAVIRGTAVNSDGRSNGLTAPNPKAQEALLRDTYRRVALDPTQIDYVEAHGTGTLLGDPIEAAALAAAMGAGRDEDRPLLIGSVKSNLGHTEGAAGIVSFIKTVLGLAHGSIPPSRNYRAPNRHIDFAGGRLEVVTSARAWPRYGGIARAGVSAFGFGGTNAHVVVEEVGAPARAPDGSPADGATTTFLLSAATGTRLAATANALADWLSDAKGDSEAPLPAIAHTLARRRRRSRVRAAVSGRSRQDLTLALRALATGARNAAVSAPSDSLSLATARHPGSVWVFSGHGSQWVGMGRGLLDEEPDFAAAVQRLDPDFSEVVGYSLSDALRSDLDVTDVARSQVALYGMQLALAALWRANGLEPSGVIGFSFGEVPAAVVAGALSARDGLIVMALRSRLLQTLNAQGEGAMAVVDLSEEEFDQLRTEVGPEVVISVYSSPAQCTIGGPRTQVQAVVEHVEAMGRNAWLLDVTGAGHTSAVDPILPELEAGLRHIVTRRPEVAIYSTVTGSRDLDPVRDARYWVANVRQPVRFGPAVAAAATEGCKVFVEVAPHPIAQTPINRTLSHLGIDDALVVGSLVRGADEAVAFRTQLARLHQADVIDAGSTLVRSAAHAELPLPAWQRRRFWVDSPPATQAAGHHPLLGAHVEDPSTGRHIWQADDVAALNPWLLDHGIAGVPVVPAAAFAEMAMAAAIQAAGPAGGGVPSVRDLQLHEVLVVEDGTRLTTVLTPDGAGGGSVDIYARPASAATPLRHATARVAWMASPLDPVVPELLAPSGGDTVDVYDAFAVAGHTYGKAFTGVQRATVDETGVASAEVVLDPAAGPTGGYGIHPALLDLALQTLAACASTLLPGAARADLYVPVSIDFLRLSGTPGSAGRCVARLVVPEGDGSLLMGQLRLEDLQGRTVLEASGIGLRRFERSVVPVPLSERLFESVWEPAAGVPGPTPPAILLIAAGAPEITASALAGGLQARGFRVAACEGSSGEEIGAALATLGQGTPDGGVHVVLLAAGSPRGPGGALVPAQIGSWAHDLVLAAAEVVVTADDHPKAGQLSLVTVGAAPIHDGEAGDPAGWALAALTRVVHFERPGMPTRTVDLDGTDDPDSLIDTLARELVSRGDNEEVGYRKGERLVRRIVHARAVVPGDHRPVRDGAYIVTGGSGGLGLEVARWLARAGAARVILNSRRAPGAEAQAAITSLRESGADVAVVLGDIADPVTAPSLVGAATAGGVPVLGVVHAAGMGGDGTLDALAPALEQSWRARVEGASNLHAALAGHDLDFFVAFSSAAASLGSAGQAPLATASGWMDGLMAWRRAQGLPGTTINWSRWAEVGSGTDLTDLVLDALLPAEGIEALAAILSLGTPAATVARLDIRRALSLLPEARNLPLLGRLLPDDEAQGGGLGAAVADVRTLAATDPAAARRSIADRIVAHLALVMGHREEDIDRRMPLTSLGIDSLMAVRAKSRIEHDYDRPIPVRVLLQGVSVDELASHVLGELTNTGHTALAPAAGEAVAPSPDSAAATPRPPRTGPVLAGRDATERWVMAVWAEVLQTQISAVDTFEDLGGDAGQASDITRMLLARVGQKVGEAELWAPPTSPASQADLLREHIEGNGGAEMRILRAEGDQTPLFVFHPAGGSTAVYQPLADLLDGVPVFGFDRVEGFRSIEEKVEHYVNRILEIRPEGPYRLAGWSLGGGMAYEAARRLSQLGRRVEVVAMIDTILPARNDDEDERAILGDRYARFLEYLNEMYSVTIPISVDELLDMEEDVQVTTLLAAVEDAGLGLSPGLLEHQRTSYIDARMGEKFQPQPYDGRVILFRATEVGLTTTLDPRYARADETLGWDLLAPALEVIRVEGDHTSLIDPPAVGTIATHLQNAFKEEGTVTAAEDSTEVRA